MRFLRTNTAVRLTVGPFLDKTDGITPETALTATNEKLTFMVDDSNVPTLVIDANATASAGNNDMVHVTGDDAGFYDLELTAAQTNYLGRAMLAITYATDHCPVFHEFMILPAMMYDSLVLGTDRLDTNVTHVNDVAASSVTTVNAVLGTSSAVTVTSGRVNADVTHIATAAVSTSTAQLGVNAVQAGGTAWGSGAITAASIASDAITAAKVADGTIDAATFAASAITATVIASDAITAAKIADNAIDRATFAADTGLQSIRSNTAQAGASTTITLDASASAVDDYYNHALILTTGGTGSGQYRIISDYVGSTKVATVDSAWATNPDNTTTFVILPAASTAADIADAVWDEARSGHVTSGTFGQYTPANVTFFGGTAGTFASGRPEVNTSHFGGTAGTFASGRAEVNISHFGGSAGTFSGGRPEVNLSHVAGNAVSTTSAQLGVNVVQLSSDTTAADNAEAFFDGTGYAGTNNVIPSVTATGSVTGNVGGNVTGSIGSLATQAKADVNGEMVDALTVDVLADSLATDGSRPTFAQAALGMYRFLFERSVSSTTLTVRKEDGSTAAMTFTLSDATSPQSITRTT